MSTLPEIINRGFEAIGLGDEPVSGVAALVGTPAGPGFAATISIIFFTTAIAPFNPRLSGEAQPADILYLMNDAACALLSELAIKP